MRNAAKPLMIEMCIPHIGSFAGESRIAVNIESIPDGSLSIKEYRSVRTNTEGFIRILPKLSDEAIHWVFAHVYEPNASYMRGHGSTYNDLLIGEFIPELLRRLKLAHDPNKGAEYREI